MPDIDAKKIAELRSLLAKATLGPWSTHLVDDTTIMSPAREVATTCDSSQTDREDGYNIEYEQMEADAALIVAMRNAMPALLDLASLSLASASGEDGKLLRVIDETLQAMASQASVPMDLWDKHSNSVLTLMARIRSLSAEVVEWRTESHSANDRAFANAAERDTLSAQLAEARRERDEAREATNNIKYRLKNRIDLWLNDHLVEMREGYDDSIVGFNEAWDIIRSVFADGESNNAGK